jgi:4-nitrophenyl phosphatase
MIDMSTGNTLRRIRNLIIDMDGVLYLGNQVVPGASRFLRFLRRSGIPFALATNNSTRTPRQYVEKLAGMGIIVQTNEILTSAQATASYLSSIAPPEARVFAVGLDGLRTALHEAGYVPTEGEADYVVVGFDPTICYERLAKAALLIRAGARFIATNPDPTLPSETGPLPGAGALLAFLEAATGVSPTIIGKPATTLLEQALTSMDAHPTTTAMLGDRLETDILAGRRAGMHTLLVLSGATDQALLAGAAIQPDLVFKDVGHLHAVWQEMLDG